MKQWIPERYYLFLGIIKKLKSRSVKQRWAYVGSKKVNNTQELSETKKAPRQLEIKGGLSDQDSQPFKPVEIKTKHPIWGRNVTANKPCIHSFLAGQHVAWTATLALAGVAQWIEHWSVNQKATGSIPCQGTCLGCRPGPQSGACKSHLIDVSLLNLSLKINKIFLKNLLH